MSLGPSSQPLINLAADATGIAVSIEQGIPWH